MYIIESFLSPGKWKKGKRKGKEKERQERKRKRREEKRGNGEIAGGGYCSDFGDLCHLTYTIGLVGWSNPSGSRRPC